MHEKRAGKPWGEHLPPGELVSCDECGAQFETEEGDMGIPLHREGVRGWYVLCLTEGCRKVLFITYQRTRE